MSVSLYILGFAAILGMIVLQAWLVSFIRKPNKRNYPQTSIWEKLGAGVIIIIIIAIQVGLIEDLIQ